MWIYSESHRVFTRTARNQQLRLQGHAGRQAPYRIETSGLEHRRELVDTTRPATAHREQVEAEVGVAHRLGARRAGHRFGEQQRATGR